MKYPDTDSCTKVLPRSTHLDVCTKQPIKGSRLVSMLHGAYKNRNDSVSFGRSVAHDVELLLIVNAR